MKHLLRFFTLTMAILAPYLGVVESNAQNILTQGFEGSFPPTGWNNSIYNAGGGTDLGGYGCSTTTGLVWIKANSFSSNGLVYNTFCTNYTYAAPSSCTAHGGTGMAAYNSWDNSSTSTAALITPALNLTTYSGGNYTLTFWFRNPGGDGMQVLVNTSASLSGATTIAASVGTNSVFTQKTYTIPAAFNSSSNVYIIFNAISNYGQDMFLDDVAVNFTAIPCSGTPTAPTITSSAISSPLNCSSSATITASNPNSAGGNYQIWQTGPSATGPWTNIAGATSLTYTTPSLNATTYYRFMDSCGNSHLTNASASYAVPINTSTSISIAVSPGTTICTGSTANFTATPTNGGANPAYQWQKNGTNVGSNLPSYSDATLNTGDAMKCIITSNASCVITNTANSNILNMTVFSVVPTVSISANPNTTICPGTSVLFTATPANQGATPAYQWYKNGASISGATSATYTDNGLYNSDAIYCMMTSSAQCAIPASANSNLISVYNTTPISISSQPANSVVCNGNGTIFSVTASAGSTISYQWMVNTGTGFTAVSNGGIYSGATTSQLSISSSTLTMNGYQYKCIMNATCALSQTNVAVLDVNMPPNIVVQPSNVTSCTNANANFAVTANGNSLTYQWKESTGGPFNAISNGGIYSGATSANLTLSNPTASMNGYQYQCVISGACTPTLTTGSVTLNVNAVPSASAPTNSTICAGGNTSFSTTGTGTNITYQWQANGNNISNNSTYSGATTNTLSITAAAAGMNGTQYHCIVSGICTPAATSANATLNVNTAPAITGSSNQPQSLTICPNGNANFGVTANGAGLTYQWYENGIAISNGGIYSGATSNSLTITGAANTMNNNQYTCTLSGTCTPPLTSSAATLSFYTVPGIAVQPQAIAVCQGLNGTITFVPSGSGTSYQWMVNTGSGFTNISGATSTSLTINNVNTGMNGYLYQCVVSGTCNPPVTTNPVALTVNTNPNIPLAGQPANNTLCAGSSGTFTVAPTGSGLVYQWKVNTGSGYVNVSNGGVYSGATSPTLTISGATINMSAYSYECNVSGICGTPVLSAPAVLTVDTLPAISTQPTNTNVCINHNTSLSCAAFGTNISYQWMVNNGAGFVNVTNGALYSGATTNTLNITSAPLSINNYQYRCVVSGTCTPSANSTVITLQVYTPPAITVSVPNDTVCEGSPAIFNVGASGSVLNYQWQINTGTGFVNIPNAFPFIGVYTPVLSINPVSFLMNGYTYRCVISGACTPVDTSNFGQLTVNRLPTITSQPLSSAICNGGSTSFTVGAYGTGISYQWKENAGSGFLPISNGGIYSGATSATLALSGASNNMAGYLYQVVISGTCLPKATSNNDTLGFHPQPDTTITTSGQTTFCAGDSVKLSVSSGNTYQWRRNGSDIPGATNATYKATTSGYYTVKVTSGFGCVALSPVKTVTAVAIPAAPINTILGNLAFCKGDSVVFGTNTNVGLIYQWYKNGTAITLNGTGTTYTAKVSGTYDVAVSTIVGPATCSATSANVPVIVNDIPADSVSLSGLLPVVCSNGGGLTLSTVPVSGQTYTAFQWKQNGFDITGANAAQYVATAGGWYNVAITNNLGCTIDTRLLFLKYVVAPAPVITQSGTYTLYAGYFVNANYQWYLNGNATGSNSATLTVSQNGTYTVSVTDSTLCSDTSSNFYLVNLAVQNVISAKDVRVYPNPATTIVSIDAPVKVNATVMSLQGKVVMSRENVKSLDISQLANGVYMIQVYDENNVLVKTEKLVKSSW